MGFLNPKVKTKKKRKGRRWPMEDGNIFILNKKYDINPACPDNPSLTICRECRHIPENCACQAKVYNGVMRERMYTITRRGKRKVLGHLIVDFLNGYPNGRIPFLTGLPNKYFQIKRSFLNLKSSS